MEDQPTIMSVTEELSNGKPHPQSPPDSTPSNAEEQVNILLVDDRPENLLALEAVLSELGQRMVRAYTGREALSALLKNEFAVILLDVRLPEMDGFETASIIRTRNDSRHTPIIFITANDKSDTNVSKGYSLGAVDYIFKPLDPDILKAKVSVFIDLFRKTQEIKNLNADLERRVEQRTGELRRANAELENEIAERRRIEAEVRELNADLEQRVRQRTAELEAANRELQAFSYSVSHDLRAPLRKMDSFSRLLLEDCAEVLLPVGKDYVRRIRNSARHMNELIDDLLKLSRVTSNEMNREPVDLTSMAHQIAGELEREQPERKVEWTIGDTMEVNGDRGLLHLALQNLLENAWKFTSKQDASKIEFGLSRIEGQPVYFVRDNGAGFEMAYAEKLFDPFMRLHPSSEFPGTGIGLAIAQRAIRRHGGRVWAEGETGQGACFYFNVP